MNNTTTLLEFRAIGAEKFVPLEFLAADGQWHLLYIDPAARPVLPNDKAVEPRP